MGRGAREKDTSVVSKNNKVSGFGGVRDLLDLSILF